MGRRLAGTRFLGEVGGDTGISLRVMIVEADPEYSMVFQNALENYGYEVEVCSTGAIALSRLDTFHPNVIMVDKNLEDVPASKLISQVKEKGFFVPIVLVIDDPAHVPEAQALETGISDFVIKEQHPAYLHFIAKSIFSAYKSNLIELENKHLLDLLQKQNLELERKKKKLQSFNLTDPDTGFFSLATFNEILGKMFGQVRRNLRPLTVLQVGLDHMELVEETFGAEFTVSVVKDVASQMARVFRESDSMARIEDHRMAVLLPDTPPENAVHLVERLKKTIKGMTYFDGETNHEVTISIGVASIPGSRAATPDGLLERAGVLLSRAVTHGGNRIMLEDNQEEAIRRLTGSTYFETIVADMSHHMDEIQKEQLEMAESLVRQFRDNGHPFVHSPRSAELAVRLSIKMGLDPDRVEKVRMAALLRDLGMAAVPTEWLNREGPLSADEWKVIQRHPEWTLELLKNMTFLQEELVMIRHHHERVDGKGYPLQLKGSAIPIGSRILACADAYVAMTDDRPHRKAYNSEKAISEMKKLSGTWFDAEVVEHLEQMQG